MDLTDSACRMWSDPLPEVVAKQVIANGLQVHGIDATKAAFPDRFKRRAH